MDDATGLAAVIIDKIDRTPHRGYSVTATNSVDVTGGTDWPMYRCADNCICRSVRDHGATAAGEARARRAENRRRSAPSPWALKG